MKSILLTKEHLNAGMFVVSEVLSHCSVMAYFSEHASCPFYVFADSELKLNVIQIRSVLPLRNRKH